MKEIAVLGSTGSIGTQALDVIAHHPGRFHAAILAAHQNIDLLLQQAELFSPHAVAITDPDAGAAFRVRYTGKAAVFVGKDAMTEALSHIAFDTALVAVTGMAGLLPTLAAISLGKDVALANKETLVAGGALVMRAAAEKGVRILPVDSEHSAIFQSLLGQDTRHIHRLILTASGGPFRGKTKDELKRVTLSDCLAHPTWDMGQKVTIDSASMFNKGLEIIEAHWLFDVDYDRIHVVVQPQSLIHSMVEYDDGSVIAQIGAPDMRLPIQFALTYPERLPTPSGEFLDWTKIGKIDVAEPDRNVFRSLDLAYAAGKAGGDTATAFNAANEEAVSAFIQGNISFLQLFDVTAAVLDAWTTKKVKTIADIWEADRRAREAARRYMREALSC